MVFAAIALTTYATIGIVGGTIPGVEELVDWLSRVDGRWILFAAFLAILIEGLYFVGSFFPGSTLVVIVAVLSQMQSWTLFALTILAIFIGWILAGAVNITLALLYRKTLSEKTNNKYEVKDRVLTTWFPAFRASYEVSQIVSGGNPLKVFWSSVRVKFLASSAAAAYVLVLPFIIDINELENEEGFLTVIVVAAITFAVGLYQIIQYKKHLG